MRSIRALIAILACLVAACDAGPTGPAPAAPPGLAAPSTLATGVATPVFNPQPDPPKVLQFVSYDLVAGSARGSFTSCSGPGSIAIARVASRVVGDAVELTQTWSFLPPSACMRPVSVTLRGTLSQRTGMLTLDGKLADGTRVHVSARTSGALGGGIAGQVAFDPQPDPPQP